MREPTGTAASSLRAQHEGVGVPESIAEVEFTFDGVPISALPGQSVGGALLAAGIRSWRSTRMQGRPRGLFCGIGICYDCLITVGNAPNVRACLAPAQAGAVVTTQEGAGVYRD